MELANNGKLYRRVIGSVLNEIKAGKFPIGSRLPPERDLATLNSVSRTTVREAMVALEMLGFVEMRKGSGIYVTSDSGRESPTDLDVGAFELMEARRMIESEIASLAAHYITPEHVARLRALLSQMKTSEELEAEQADRDFHIAIAEATGNGALVSVVTDLWDMRERAPLARNILHRARGPGFSSRVKEHAAVLNALERKDPAAARAAMRAHLDRVVEHLLITTENEEVEAARTRSASLRRRVQMSGM